MFKMTHKAFTMVELIFVIVIIGILSSVAIPKLAATRDDAYAAICTEVTQRILSEITAAYARNGYTKFSTLGIGSISSISTSQTEGNGILDLPSKKVKDGITILCDGAPLLYLRGFTVANDYNITVTDLAPTDPPAAFIAADNIRTIHKIATPGGFFIYSLTD